MPVLVDVNPRLPEDAAAQIAVDIRGAVAAGFMDALEAVTYGLSLTPDEREAVEKYRRNKAANLRRARSLVARSVNAGKAQS